MARFRRVLTLLMLLVCAAADTRPAPRANLSLPASVPSILDHIYSFRPDLALPEIHQLEQQSPASPLGYLLEAELGWWPIWCASAEYKYGMTAARHHEKSPGDQRYLELTTKAYRLAQAGIQSNNNSAEMHLYAAMADALAARLYGVRAENRATARAGVRARENFLKALALDPSLADVDTGLGLYNYYVDTLSTVARVLRFFMGIPGGSKEEGIRQLERGMKEGQLTPVVARFYLAVNLHSFDQRYEEALQVIAPLCERYPQNPIFRLAQGDLYGKLGRKAPAEAAYHAAEAAIPQIPDAECREKLSKLVQVSLAALGSQ